MPRLRTGPRFGAGLLLIALLVAACGSASTSPSTGPSAAPPDTPVSAPPGGGGVDPGVGDLVVPKPGQLDIHPVPAEAFTATVDGSTIHVVASWTSGVEPCYVLDSIVVDRGEGVFTITLQEGHGPGDMACIEIAKQHQTTFDIPDVTPGTWTIRDGAAGAPDIEVTVG
jgi:hypothetical protein